MGNATAVPVNAMKDGQAKNVTAQRMRPPAKHHIRIKSALAEASACVANATATKRTLGLTAK